MSEQKQVDCAAMAGPGNEHERLKAFVGTFRAQVKMWMGPGEPTMTTGTMTCSMQLEDRFLHQEYKGDPGEGPFPNFQGRGYWGFNKATGMYEGFWIDSASTMMQTESGNVDDTGKQWTMSGEMTWPDGQKVVKRSVITLQDDDHNMLEMYFVKGGEEKKGMEIRYTRA